MRTIRALWREFIKTPRLLGRASNVLCDGEGGAGDSGAGVFRIRRAELVSETKWFWPSPWFSFRVAGRGDGTDTISRPFRAWENGAGQSRASLAGWLCPGLFSFAPSGLNHEDGVTAAGTSTINQSAPSSARSANRMRGTASCSILPKGSCTM